MKSRYRGVDQFGTATQTDWKPDPSRPPRPGNEPHHALLAQDREHALRLVDVSRETLERLDLFVGLLLDWQKATNLVAASTLNSLWTRHIADSLQLAELVPGVRTFVDLGSGAGFPGLMLACATPEDSPSRFILIEANRKKAAFLRHAIEMTTAPALVREQRIEAFVQEFRGRADVVTARALAPFGMLLEQAEPLLKTGAQALFLKGQDVEEELNEATRCWTIDVVLVPSKTDPKGRIVHVKSATRRSA
jgi:16S rRNA (guanine527-N7)-methyltransferase